MIRVLKTLLLWLLMAALPLQAGASIANATSCGSGYPPAAQAADRHAHEVAAQDACDCRHDMACSPLSDDASENRHPNANCQTGAACCAGAVAPPSMELSISLCNDAQMVALSPSDVPIDYVPVKPKRPPRSIFA